MALADLLITFWAASVQAHGNGVNGLYLGMYLGAEILSVVSLLVTCSCNMLLMAPRSAKRLHRTILDTVMAAPLLFFTSTDLGVTVNRFSQDMSLIDMELPSAFLELAADIAVGLTQAVLMCLSAGYFAASMPFVAVLLYFVQQYYLRTSRQLRLLDLEAKSPLYSHFMETLEGLVTVRAFGWSRDFEAKNAQLLDTSQKPFYLLYCIQRWLGLVLDLTVAALTVVLMIIVVKLRFTVNPGFVALALVNVNGFNLSLTELIKSWTRVETSMGAVTRVRSFAKETASENFVSERADALDDQLWPRKGVIELKNLCAYYKPDSLVLKNLSLSIQAGQKIGICGGSGSGKSSIIAALFRMLEVQTGSITIDGVDITQLSRQEVRSRINAIPQEAYFFKGSVRTNLDPLNRCEDSELEIALRYVKLWTIVEEKGGLNGPADAEMFSHGQRQLFCLARAILRPCKVVVLDEATANVDLETDELMQKIIREVFEGCTILAVAHRLDTIMDFDRIAVVKAGELIEYDTPKELMSRDSAFKALYELH
jgi:ATP-binding cassette, subfamily C (CFTR/MRP), member 1